MPGNIRLLRDCGVDGVLSLSAYNSRGFGDRLKANFAAHLLWNPDLNETEFINKFMTLYFGKDAAPFMIRMYRRMQESLTGKLWVYDEPTLLSKHHQAGYLSSRMTEEYYSLLSEAVEACGGDETYLKRLRFERLCLLYVSIKSEYGTQEELALLKDEFKELCAEFSVTRLNETGTVTVVDFCK